jgi:hypothetical protein
MSTEESKLGYIPTQILAEMFQEHGYDGVQYNSLLGNEHNVVLFDLASAEILSCELSEIKSLRYETECHGEERRVY